MPPASAAELEVVRHRRIFTPKNIVNLQLIDKRALVTGSSDGIGAAIAKALAAEGAVVAVHGRDEGRAKDVVQVIEASGGRAVFVLGDLTNDEQTESPMRHRSKTVGRDRHPGQ